MQRTTLRGAVLCALLATTLPAPCQETAAARAGARLEYVSTILLPTNGQAFDWDIGKPHHIWSIERKQSALVESELPH